MKQHTTCTAVGVLSLLVLFVSAVFAKTNAEWQQELTVQRAKLAEITSELEKAQPELQQKEAKLDQARARYTAVHEAWKGLGYRLHNIAAGYGFDEVSIARAKANVVDEQARLVSVTAALAEALARREDASKKLNHAKQYQLDSRDAFRALYAKAEKDFSEVNGFYFKLYTDEKLVRGQIVHWENVAIQLEDKVAEDAFTRLRDEVLKLRVHVKSLQMRQKQAQELADAVAAFLK